MKILQLCKKIPYPLKDGESIAIHYLSKGLVHQDCTVHLLAFNTKKHFVDYSETPAQLAHYSLVQKLYLDTSIQPLSALANLFTSESYNIQRFINQEFEQTLIDLLKTEDFDIVQLETLYMAPYIQLVREYSKAKIVMRSHNLESEIWSNLSSKTSNFLKKKYFRICAERLNSYELQVQQTYDSLLPISQIDAEKYHQNDYDKDSLVTPIGLDMDRYNYSQSELNTGALKLGYIGSLDWKPNIEGLDWFISKVWKSLSAEHGELEFHLAGRNPGTNFQSVPSSNFVMHGEVDDALSFIRQLDVMIVPLFSGSGMRVKILECMALGKLVISTPKGFEGIPVEHGKNCLVFNDKNELLSAIAKCVHEPEKGDSIMRAARSLVENNFDYRSIAKRVKQHYIQLISQE